MQLMDESIAQLLDAGLITVETAREHVEIKKRFR